MNSHPHYVQTVAAAQLRAATEAANLFRHVRSASQTRPPHPARIAEMKADERRRIERDLHDGAQQRLLALAMRLAAAQQQSETARLREAVAHGIREVTAAIEELRELANGIPPTCLTSRGLRCALVDLAARTPVPIAVHAVGDRFDVAVETAMWFVASEAVTNALRHAGADTIEIELLVKEGHLILFVADDGIGGADLEGHGLRGLIRRVEALGGHLSVDSPPGRGTTVRAELPLDAPAIPLRRAASYATPASRRRVARA